MAKRRTSADSGGISFFYFDDLGMASGMLTDKFQIRPLYHVKWLEGQIFDYSTSPCRCNLFLDHFFRSVDDT